MHTNCKSFIVAIHKPSVREPSRDLNAKQRRDDYPRQGERSNRAVREYLTRAQAKASERADQTYQADRNVGRANKVGRVEEKGRRRLPILRDGPEARLESCPACPTGA